MRNFIAQLLCFLRHIWLYFFCCLQKKDKKIDEEHGSFMEEIDFPSDFELSELNFMNRSFDDDMPLMPAMGLFKERFHTFEKILKDTSKECRDLAKLGFYCCETPDVIFHDFESFRNGDIVTALIEGKAEKQIVGLCFCCGLDIILNDLHTPKSEPVRHHLSCTFFKIPAEKKHIKDSIKPFRGWQDVDLKSLNNLRAEALGKENIIEYDEEMAKKMFDKPIPLCDNCKVNEAAVRFFPCGHNGYCISCAKAKPTCPKCIQQYHGLKRFIYF